jgi:hypothetical protein
MVVAVRPVRFVIDVATGKTWGSCAAIGGAAPRCSQNKIRSQGMQGAGILAGVDHFARAAMIFDRKARAIGQLAEVTAPGG